MKKPYVPAKGDLVWFDFDPQMGSEQAGYLPALVVSSSDYNRHGLALLCPITSKRKGYPYEVPVQVGKVHGCILADHVKNQDWRVRKCRYIAAAPPHTLKRVQYIIVSMLSQ